MSDLTATFYGQSAPIVVNYVGSEFPSAIGVTGLNIGAAGVGVYKRTFNGVSEFKKLRAVGVNLTITDNTTNDTIDLEVVGGAGGENNTASNLGAGTGMFAAKVGVDLQFKSLVSGTNIAISSTSTAITIGVTGLHAVATSGAYGDLSGRPTIDTLVPTQTGNSGKVLGTNGSAVSWVSAATGTGDMLKSTYDSNDDGIIAIAQGGTGAATAATARAALGLVAIAASGSASDLSAGTVPLARLSGITNAEIAAGAAIALSKLATDPLARANHTGTQSVSTITGLHAVATSGSYADLTSKPTIDTLVPSQTGNSGKVLGTDGSVVSWVSQSGGVASTRAINTQFSVTGGGDLSADRTINLVNDSATPGNSKYYGTDGTGTKGWFSLPSGGSESTTASNLGTGQGVWKALVGSDLQFRTLTAGANITLANNTNDIGIAVSGLAPVATSGSAADLSTGTLLAARMPALTGDVTSSAGAVATTIAAGVVTLAKMATLAANSIIGNNTGSVATPIALTATQVRTLLALTIGTDVQAFDADLTAVAALSTTGVAVRTASNTWSTRTLTGTTNQVTITNGDGVSGNPTFALPQSINTAAAVQFGTLNLGGLGSASLTDTSVPIYWTSTKTSGTGGVAAAMQYEHVAAFLGTKVTVSMLVDALNTGTNSGAGSHAVAVIGRADDKLANGTANTGALIDMYGVEGKRIRRGTSSTGDGGSGVFGISAYYGTNVSAAGRTFNVYTGFCELATDETLATALTNGTCVVYRAYGGTGGDVNNKYALIGALGLKILTGNSITATDSSTGAKSITMAHDGSDGIFGCNSGHLRITPATGSILILNDGVGFLPNVDNTMTLGGTTASVGFDRRFNVYANTLQADGVTTLNSYSFHKSITAPGTPTGGANLYCESGVLKWKNTSGTVFDLSAVGGGFSNPMTTSGDIIYGGSSGTATRLAGQTTTTKKYLSQTGNGTISAAPAWAQVAFADLSGSVATTQMPALTGDVTTSAGAVATTIANSAVTLAKMANLAANSIIGNNTGSAAAPIALSITQVKTLLTLNQTSETVSFSAAGDHDITRPAGSAWHTMVASVGAGSGAYTARMALKVTNSPAAGNRAYVQLSLPASNNPTVEIYSTDYTGSPLATVKNLSATADQVLLIFEHNGSAWFLISGTSTLTKDLPNTATTAAGDDYVALSGATNGERRGLLAKTLIGLSNVDNTSDTGKPVSTATQTALDAKEVLGEYTGINTQTGSYTLVLGDKGKLIEMNVGSANNLTIPPNSSVAFPVKSRIDISQLGAGQTTIVAGGGVTIRSSGAKLKLTGQYSGGSLVKRATDEWVLFGDITT